MQPVVVAGCPGEPSIFGLSIKKEKIKRMRCPAGEKVVKFVIEIDTHVEEKKRTAIIAANCCKMDENLRHGSQ